MPDELAGPASAPSPAAPETSAPASPAPVSAERAAADTGDFGAFDRAAVARKQGKPLADVAPTASAQANGDNGAGEHGERTISRRQQAINDYERRIAQQEQRLRDLESRVARPPASPANGHPSPEPPANGQSNGQPPAPESAKQRAARYLALPDAPKVDDFDTYPEYTAAQSLFLNDKLQAEAADVASRRQAQQAQHERLITRDQTFRERLTAAKDADPAFVPGLSEEAKNLGGLEHAKRQGVPAGPAHIIGELLYDSPQAVPFLRAISADPTLLASLVTPPAAIQQLPPPVRVKAHIDHLVTEFRRLEGRLAYETSLAAADTAPRDDAPPSSVSSAPPPPPTLTKAGRSADPVRSALDRGDFAAYDAAEMARKIRHRTAGRGGR
jgi:hypothetical protein